MNEVSAALPELSKKPLVLIDRSQLQAGNPTRFQLGNQIAAKPKWPEARIRKFQQELRSFREWLGFNYVELGKLLSFSPTYCKLMEGGYPSVPLRQPSDKFLERLTVVKASAKPKKKFRAPARVRQRANELWTHVLGKRFKCSKCAHEVKRGQRQSGLEYWWARAPGQKFCPVHQRRKKRMSKR